MITVVGSINMDLVVHTPRIPAVGETITGTAFQENPGGKGANQAVAAARLGSRVAFVGCLGLDGLGDALQGGLERDGVDVSHVRRTAAQSSGLALIQVDDAGHNNIVVVPGANHSLSCRDIGRAADCFTRSKIAMFQLEIPLEVAEYALALAKAAGCTTILNPAPAQPLTKSMLRYADILAPNEGELAILTSMPCDTPQARQAAAATLSAASGALVIVTLGGDGVLCVQGEQAIHYPANVVRAVDTTAAGDSFLGALAHRLEQGASVEDAIAFGQRAAAYTVQRQGAQPSLPTLADLG